MKEKILKYIIELVFIFIIPLALLATCFKQEKVYDENNNEVGKYLTFDNIFVLSNETTTYYNYEYYALNESILLQPNDSIKVNLNKSIWLNYNGVNKLFIYKTIDNTYSYIQFNSNNKYDDYNYIDIVQDNDLYTIYIRNNTEVSVVNTEGNLVKSIKSYTISDNVISRLLNSLYDILGITNNWILQFIVIYTLLWLVMWFIWHILYLPLDFICSKLLFDRIDK